MSMSMVVLKSHASDEECSVDVNDGSEFELYIR